MTQSLWGDAEKGPHQLVLPNVRSLSFGRKQSPHAEQEPRQWARRPSQLHSRGVGADKPCFQQKLMRLGFMALETAVILTRDTKLLTGSQYKGMVAKAPARGTPSRSPTRAMVQEWHGAGSTGHHPPQAPVRTGGGHCRHGSVRGKMLTAWKRPAPVSTDQTKRVADPHRSGVPPSCLWST